MIGIGWPGSEIYINPHAYKKDNKLTQAINCRRCGKFIDTILSDEPLKSFHEKCFDEFLEEEKESCIRIGMRIHKSKYLKGTGGTYNNYD